jgi:signal transduction histidine kinase
VTRSIRTRIVISYIAIALFVVAAVGSIFFVVLNRVSRSAQDTLLDQIADSLVGVLEADQAGPQALLAGASLRRALDATSLFNEVRIRVLDPGGRLRYASGDTRTVAVDLQRLEELFADRRAGFMMMRESMPERRRGGVFGIEVRPIVPAPLDHRRSDAAPMHRSAPGVAPSGTAQPRPGTGAPPSGPAAEPFRAEVVREVDFAGGTWRLELMGAAGIDSDLISSAAWVFALAALVALAATTGAGLWIGRQLSAPVIHLTDQARRMAEGDLAARSTVNTGDEVGDLSRQFNTMADRLSESLEEVRRERDTLRRFAGDASHELRTPITALSTFIDLMEDADGPRRGELIADSREQVERLEHLVNLLLNLTRIDGSVVHLTTAPHSLGALVDEAWAEVDPERRNRATLVAAPDTRTVVVSCDAARMSAALRNLFENALNARADATVTVSAHRVDDATVIHVSDDGPGVPEAELPRLFERFYRSPANRAAGSGLGLSIVEGIIKLHGGSVRAFNGAPGLTVEILLPALDQ